ncbi:flagellar assembly peptidoglycan hydrolase FlgJ [Crenobacter sp. HX-7-9]|uniref:Flagellar assembly peptidoglycan hydrolase FlgJ n=2 Tax=Crenobacter caeni TaxID=2705474 RepID=A0A6B2KS90_9NEIS|nr:flagellar assembly peptidoglycan hydrolase FlgJ [Crenobacter caeni]
MPYLWGFEEVFELGMALGMLVAAWRLLPASNWHRPVLALLFLLSFAMLAGCQSPQLPAAGTQPSVQHAFASRMLPMAAPAAESLGVSPALIVAHAALESGWGGKPIRSADGEDSHNLFSLKATPAWQGRTVDILTTEYLRGRPVKRIERFRAYDSYTDAFDDYARLLSGLTRYQGVLGAGDDERQFACALRRGGYATDPAYVEKLVRVSGFLKGLALPESSTPGQDESPV